MADLVVANSSTGTMGTKALKRSRFEKAEVAYGKIPAAAYAIGTDSLVFNLPAKELIHARFFFGANGVSDALVAETDANVEALEVFHGANLASAISWNVGTSTEADINYVIHYIKGTGKPAPGFSPDTDETYAHGVRIKLTPTAS